MLPSSCLVVLIVLIASMQAEITELNDDTFAEKILDNPGSDIWFVKFYQPWCGYCARMQPDWEQADAQYHTMQATRNVHFSQLDCGSSPKICDRLGIPGYPKLTLFLNGTMYDFPRDQNRTSENFLKFVNDGYLEQPARSIPSGVCWLEAIRKEVENIWHNFVFILFRYPEVAGCFMAVGTFIGIATTSIAFMFTVAAPPEVKQKIH